jgi:alpha-L-arabinofuranosidase
MRGSDVGFTRFRGHSLRRRIRWRARVLWTATENSDAVDYHQYEAAFWAGAAAEAPDARLTEHLLCEP